MHTDKTRAKKRRMEVPFELIWKKHSHEGMDESSGEKLGSDSQRLSFSFWSRLWIVCKKGGAMAGTMHLVKATPKLSDQEQCGSRARSLEKYSKTGSGIATLKKANFNLRSL